jgi:hypothetical protein
MLVLLRLISLILVVAAIMLLGADLVTSLENNKIMVRSLDQVWALADKSAMLGFHAWCDHHLPGFLAHGIAAAFGLPGWGVTGVPGIVLAFLFGRRTADVG